MATGTAKPGAGIYTEGVLEVG